MTSTNLTEGLFDLEAWFVDNRHFINMSPDPNASDWEVVDAAQVRHLANLYEARIQSLEAELETARADMQAACPESGEPWRNEHERGIYDDLLAMHRDDRFWPRNLSLAMRSIWLGRQAQIGLLSSEVSRLSALVPKWVPVDDGEHDPPMLGQTVLLCINGVVQQETYSFDQGDNDYSGGEYFWSRDDLDECPLAEKGQHWQPLPPPPPQENPK